MTIDELLSLLSEELSGTRTKDRVAHIATHHRIQGSPGFLDALNQVRDTLDQLNIPCTTHTYPADGETKTFSWIAPLAWHVRGGTLCQLNPERRILLTFEEVPQGIIAQSQSGSVEAEVVDIGDGSTPADYQGKDPEGKLVMVTGRPQEVAPIATQHGVAGIILYPTPEKAARWPDLVQYAGFWPEASQVSETPIGFSISRRQADALLKDMQERPVRLAGSIDADLGPGSLHVLEGWIPGGDREAKEILLIAHLCHPRPSANDNASGSGLLLEIAQTLASLRRHKKIPGNRGIRFLWVPEFYGTLPWAHMHRAQVQKLAFVLNLDMVGQSPEKLGEPFHVWRVPNSIPSFLNSWFEPLLRRIAEDPRSIAPGGTRRPMQWRVDSPSGGSDHVVFTDPTFGVPAVMFNHDDPLHHTQLDDLDMVDPTELKRVGILSAAVALLPEIITHERTRVASWLLKYSLNELTRAFELSLDKPDRFGTDLLTVALRIEEARADSFANLLHEASTPWDNAGHRAVLSTACKELVGQLHAAPPATKTRRKANAERLPKKSFEGPLPYRALRSLPVEARRFMDKEFTGPYGAIVLEALNLCDGNRSMRDIALQLSLEFGRPLSDATVLHALEILHENNWVTL